MIRLLGNKLAVVPLFDPDQYGHIVIPEQAKERVDQGIVKYVGPSCELVKIGDHIIFSGYTGSTVEIEGEGLLIVLPEDFVTAVLETPSTNVAGLYFVDSFGLYHICTYEMAMRLIGKAFMEAPWADRIKFNVKGDATTRPKIHEYDNLH